jgi:DNA phosphorothioation-dependent restriction protein DptG
VLLNVIEILLVGNFGEELMNSFKRIKRINGYKWESLLKLSHNTKISIGWCQFLAIFYAQHLVFMNQIPEYIHKEVSTKIQNQTCDLS